MRIENKANVIVSSIITNDNTRRYTERTLRIVNDSELLSQRAKDLANVHSDIAQGNMFELLETSKFNLDALQKDSDLYAQTTESMGLPTDPVDIIIKRNNKVIREVQAKSCNMAARSTYSLSDKKYAEMQRLAPSDQHQEIERLLKQRIKAGTLKKEDYQQTLRNLKKSLSYEDIASTGTTHQEAVNATTPEAAKEIAKQFKRKAILTDMHQSGKAGANIGGSIAAATTLLTDGLDVLNSEKQISECVVNTAINGAQGYATGYITTALSKGIEHSICYYLEESIAKSLSRSNAHVALAVGVVNSSKSLASYMLGQIELEELSNQLSHMAITSSSAFYYGALGQTAIPVPVVGAVVGSCVGYLIGNMLHQSGLIALGDSQVVSVAKERRKQVEQICLTAIPSIRQKRIELEQQIKAHFKERESELIAGLSLMDTGIISLNCNTFFTGLQQINEQFAVIQPYKSFAEFDTMMMSDNAFEF